MRTKKPTHCLGVGSPLQITNVLGEQSLDRLDFTQEKYLTNTKDLYNITIIKSARYLEFCLLIFIWICNATDNQTPPFPSVVTSCCSTSKKIFFPVGLETFLVTSVVTAYGNFI